MKPGTPKDIPYEVISLEPYAGLSTLYERLAATRASRVVIFVPRQIVELRNPLNLRLLHRRAEAHGCEIYLVCEDLRTRLAAMRESLPAVAGPRGLPRSIRRATRKPGAPPLLSFPQRGLPVLLAPASAALLGVAVAVAVFVLIPGATIEIQPIERTIDETLVIEARGDDDRSSGTTLPDADGVVPIPARTIVHNFPVVKRLEPTGVRREPATAATGQVLLLNRTNERQTIPRGAEVIQPEGPAFLTIAPVELPPIQWSAARVGIVAKDLGPGGNLPAQTIDRFADQKLNLQASVINEQPTSGGADADRTFVLPEDYVDLREGLRADLRAAAVDALQRTREPGESIYPETVHYQVLDETYSHPIDAVTDSLALTVTVASRSPAFSGDAVQRAARDTVLAASGPGFSLVDGTFQSRPLEAIDWSDDRVRFRVRATAQIRTAIDEVAIRQLTAGLTPNEAKALLNASLPLAGPPHITLFPEWQTALPAFDWRIRVHS